MLSPFSRHGGIRVNSAKQNGRTGQKANRKSQNAKVKSQERLPSIIAVLALALPFAFCALPFDFFFPAPARPALRPL
jgi:hypothetical protein